MDTVIVASNQFHSHYPKRIPKGTVNAEQVEIRLDSEWDDLTVIVHWLNVDTGVEITPMLERDGPNTIPWEVLDDLGELRMGLIGMDGGVTVKPTIWLTYGYVVDGVDPDGGDDPQEPTPNYLAQMVEQATQANQAAQAAQKAAEEVAESVASAGPYAEEAKKSAEAAKASEEAAATSAQQANAAAQTAQNAAGSIGDAVEQAQSAATAARTAQQAAETAQADASNYAGTAQGAASTANQAAQEAQSAATQAGEYLDGVNAAAGAATNAAIAAGKSQEAAQSAAQEAANARDQATTAATTAQGHASAASTAKNAAEQAATNAGNAQAGAAQSAQTAASSASAAQAAQQGAEAAAAIIPPLSAEVANQFLAADEAGKSLRFVPDPSGGGSDNWELISEVTISEQVRSVSFTQDSSGNPLSLRNFAVICNASNASDAIKTAYISVNGEDYLNMLNFPKTGTDVSLGTYATGATFSGGFMVGGYAAGAAGGTSASNYIKFAVAKVRPEKIESVAITLAAAIALFDVGGVFRLYGVRV